MGHSKIENGLGTTIGDAVEFLLETGYRDALQLSDRFNIPDRWDTEVRWLAACHRELTVGFAMSNMYHLTREHPATGESRRVVEQWVKLLAKMIQSYGW